MIVFIKFVCVTFIIVTKFLLVSARRGHSDCMCTSQPYVFDISSLPNQVTAATSCSVYIAFLFYVDIVVCVNYVHVCDNIIQVNEYRLRKYV